MLQKTKAFYYQEVFCPAATRPSSHGGDHAPLLAPSDSLVSAADPVFASWAGLHYCADHKTRESCCIDMILPAATFARAGTSNRELTYCNLFGFAFFWTQTTLTTFRNLVFQKTKDN